MEYQRPKTIFLLSNKYVTSKMTTSIFIFGCAPAFFVVTNRGAIKVVIIIYSII